MAASEIHVLMVDFAPYKCISNRWETGVSESNERIFIHLWRAVMQGGPKK